MPNNLVLLHSKPPAGGPTFPCSPHLLWRQAPSHRPSGANWGTTWFSCLMSTASTQDPRGTSLQATLSPSQRWSWTRSMVMLTTESWWCKAPYSTPVSPAWGLLVLAFPFASSSHNINALLWCKLLYASAPRKRRCPKISHNGGYRQGYRISVTIWWASKCPRQHKEGS